MQSSDWIHAIARTEMTQNADGIISLQLSL
jgi:hypothetical protein